MSPLPKTFRAPFQLSESEHANALVALQVLNVTVRGLLTIETPALALLVATADTLVEAGWNLLDLATRTGDPTTRGQAAEALRSIITMLQEFFEAEIQQRELLLPGDVPGSTSPPSSGSIM